MQTQFSTLALISTHLWLDNTICQRGQAYTNYSSQLVYQPDTRLGSNWVAYASPFKSWVCDSGISGTYIPQGISGSFGSLTRGQSGLVIDFENGRVILPAAFGTTAIVSGSYAFKDFNVYKANETQEAILFTNKYYLNARFPTTLTGGYPPPYSPVTPCMFVTNGNEVNKNWALGGLYDSTYTMSINVLAENMSQLEGALSILADSKDQCYPLVPTSAWPLNNFGDYKSGYNYQQVVAQYGNPSNLVFVTNVRTTKVSDYAKADESLFLGIAEITCEFVRRIHV